MLKRTGSEYEMEDDEDVVIREREVDGITFERRDPYGFWYVTSHTHPKLDGAFSNNSAVEKAVAEYKVAIAVEAKKAAALKTKPAQVSTPISV